MGRGHSAGPHGAVTIDVDPNQGAFRASLSEAGQENARSLAAESVHVLLTRHGLTVLECNWPGEIWAELKAGGGTFSMNVAPDGVNVFVRWGKHQSVGMLDDYARCHAWRIVQLLDEAGWKNAWAKTLCTGG